MRTYNRSATLGKSALGAAIVALLVAHLVESGLSPKDHQLSEYANGPHGWVFTAAMVLWAIALVAGAPAVGGAVRWCFVVAGAAAVVVATFPTQAVRGKVPLGVERSAGGWLHDRAVLVLSIALVVACLLVIRDRSRPMMVRVPTAALLGTGVASSVVLLAIGDPAPGIRQRLLVAAAFGVYAVVVACRPPASVLTPGRRRG